MSETIKYIKNFNIGERVTSTTNILLDRGFRGVTGTIRTIVKDEMDSWQYLIDLDDGRVLQCDDWHLKQPTLNPNQQEMLDWLQAYGDKDGGDKPFQTIFYISECFRTGRLDYSVLANLSKLNRKQQAQVLQVFSQWVLDQEESDE